MEKHPLRIGIGDVVEFIVFFGRKKGETTNGNLKKRVKQGEVVAVVPAGSAPNRAWLNHKLGIQHYTYDFKLGVAYAHETYIIKTGMGKRSFSYARPRVHNITKVVMQGLRQPDLFDKPEHKKIVDVLANQIAEEDAIKQHPQPLLKSPSQTAHDLAKSLSGHVITFVRGLDISNSFTFIDGTAMETFVTGGRNESGGSYTSIYFK